MGQRQVTGAASVIFVFVGLAFAGWGPAMLPSFGIELGALVVDGEATNSLRLAAFSRMFGIVLACLGAALWVANARADSRELGLLAGMVFVASALALAQQVSVWGTPAGGLLAMVLAAGGGALAGRSISRRREANRDQLRAPVADDMHARR